MTMKIKIPDEFIPFVRAVSFLAERDPSLKELIVPYRKLEKKLLSITKTIKDFDQNKKKEAKEDNNVIFLGAHLTTQQKNYSKGDNFKYALSKLEKSKTIDDAYQAIKLYLSQVDAIFDEFNLLLEKNSEFLPSNKKLLNHMKEVLLAVTLGSGIVFISSELSKYIETKEEE